MTTRAEKVADGYRLTGTKMWISNAPIADVFVVWAKSAAHDNADPRLRARKGHEGPVGAQDRRQAVACAASITGEIVMDGVVVPEDNLLPNVSGLKGPFGCLNRARYGIAWGAMGAAEDCWHRARQYTLDRKQFGRPLAADAARPEEARRHADGDRARPAGCAAGRAPVRRGQDGAGDDLASSSATTAARRSTSRASRATCTAATASRSSIT